MMSHELESIAQTLVAEGKGILAADETVPTLTRRFDTLGIQSTEQSRRAYREMLFTAPGAAEFISGVILQDETIRQRSSAGIPLAEVLANQGILPGIKVDTGAKPLAGFPARQSPKASTGFATASQSIMEWAPASRNGGPSSMLRRLCRASPASARMRMPSRDMPRSVRNSTSCRSSSRKC
jgi:hypothetical protein